MRRGGIRFERGTGTERGETAALRGQRRLAAAGGDLLQRADGPEAFGVTRRFIAGPPEAAAISDLLHGRSAGTSRPTDALAAGPGDGGDRPVVGSPAIPTASDLTRTSVRELIDGFAEPLLEGSLENCCPMVYRSALHPRRLSATSTERFWQSSCPQQTRIRTGYAGCCYLTDGLGSGYRPTFLFFPLSPVWLRWKPPEALQPRYLSRREQLRSKEDRLCCREPSSLLSVFSDREGRPHGPS